MIGKAFGRELNRWLGATHSGPSEAALPSSATNGITVAPFAFIACESIKKIERGETSSPSRANYRIRIKGLTLLE